MPYVAKLYHDIHLGYSKVEALLNSASRSLALTFALLTGAATAEPQLLSVAPSYLPSFFGIGLGSYPDYVGSDDMALGAAPFGRKSLGDQRYISLQGNFVTINLLEDPNWRLGPAGMWRFGRKNVDDDIVQLLPEIDGSLELGTFAAYETVGDDPRDRWRFGASFTHGVTGDNEGFVAAASLNRWVPVGRYAAFNFSLATTFGSSDYMDTNFSVDAAGAARSGLAIFDAGTGIRDMRATAIFVQPLSREWQIGGGFLYSRLMNDAARSPIVSERGNRDQFVFGLGISRAF